MRDLQSLAQDALDMQAAIADLQSELRLRKEEIARRCVDEGRWDALSVNLTRLVRTIR